MSRAVPHSITHFADGGEGGAAAAYSSSVRNCVWSQRTRAQLRRQHTVYMLCGYNNPFCHARMPATLPNTHTYGMPESRSARRVAHKLKRYACAHRCIFKCCAIQAIKPIAKAPFTSYNFLSSKRADLSRGKRPGGWCTCFFVCIFTNYLSASASSQSGVIRSNRTTGNTTFSLHVPRRQTRQ